MSCMQFIPSLCYLGEPGLMVFLLRSSALSSVISANSTKMTPSVMACMVGLKLLYLRLPLHGHDAIKIRLALGL